MDDLGARLRAERERLGMSQAAFATECGVGRTAQVNYEAGERFPDAKYLELAAKRGASVEYIVTGKQSVAWRKGFKRVLAQLERRLGLGALTIEGVVSLVGDDEKNRLDAKWSGRYLEDKQLALLVDAIVDDGDLIDTILFAIGTATSKLDAKLSPDKFVKIALMLLEQFKTSGAFEQSKVDYAVNLATA